MRYTPSARTCACAHRPLVRAVVLTFAVLAIAVSSSVYAMASTPVLVVIRVYNRFGVRRHDLNEARETLRSILADAGISMVWRECGLMSEWSDDQRTYCSEPLDPDEVSVRIVHSVAGDRAEHVLGYSFVEESTGRGSLGTVFADRVIRTAPSLQTTTGTLLGRAMAHELGHLLLGTNSHSASGLMQRRWSMDSTGNAGSDRWKFSVEQGAKMQAALTTRLTP